MELEQLEKLILEKNRWLTAKLSEQRGLIKTAAEAERTYRIELAKATLLEKGKGTPATLNRDVVRGQKFIADLKFDRDVSKGINDACREAIRAVQGALNSIQSLVGIERAKINLR